MRFLGFCLVFLLSVSNVSAYETKAREAFIVDATTGAILLQKNADTRMPTSSMSKVLTMYLVFDALEAGQLKLDQPVTVSEHAWKMGGSRMFLNVNSQVPVEDLIKGVIIQSGNDASVTLAEAVAGSEDQFATMMNTRAKELGMVNSHFANATGWPDPNHYSTPRDLALLAYNMIRKHGELYHYYSLPEFTYNDIRQANRNPLLGAVAGADGMKTGHTEDAGYGLIGSGKRNDRRVIMVVNGLTSMAERAEESRKLLDWALGSFMLAVPYNTKSIVTQMPVVFGEAENVNVVPARDALLTMPITGLQNAKAVATIKTPLQAPVKAGTEVGTLRITVPDVGEFDVPLVTQNDVAQKNTVALMFEKLLHLAKGS